jgi:hypothetical protein
MPYGDLERKRQWELQHRSQRLARRRELRRIEALRNAAQPSLPHVEDNGAGVLWLPVVGGVALASFSPKLAIGTGSLTLLFAAVYKKGWIWWIAGVLLLVIGILFQWNERDTKK